MKRILGTILGIAVFLGAFSFLDVNAYAEEQYVPATFTVDRVEGNAEAINSVGHLTTLRAGTEVESGSVIFTDPGSYVWITVDGYKHIKMDQNTGILVTHYQGNTDVTTYYGATFVTSDMKLPEDEHLHVRAGRIDAEVRGTYVLTEVSQYAKIPEEDLKPKTSGSKSEPDQTQKYNIDNKAVFDQKINNRVELTVTGTSNKEKVKDRIEAKETEKDKSKDPKAENNQYLKDNPVADNKLPTVPKSEPVKMVNGNTITVTEAKESGSDPGSVDVTQASVTALEGTIIEKHDISASDNEAVFVTEKKLDLGEIPVFILDDIAEDNANGGERGLAKNIKSDTGGNIDLTGLTPDNIGEYTGKTVEPITIQKLDSSDKDAQLEEWNKFYEEQQALTEQQRLDDAIKASDLQRTQAEERRKEEEKVQAAKLAELEAEHKRDQDEQAQTAVIWPLQETGQKTQSGPHAEDVQGPNPPFSGDVGAP